MEENNIAKKTSQYMVKHMIGFVKWLPYNCWDEAGGRYWCEKLNKRVSLEEAVNLYFYEFLKNEYAIRRSTKED